MRSTSATHVAIGPATPTVKPKEGAPPPGSRPKLAFRPTTPHSEDGIRMLPPPSLPGAQPTAREGEMQP